MLFVCYFFELDHGTSRDKTNTSNIQILRGFLHLGHIKILLCLLMQFALWDSAVSCCFGQKQKDGSTTDTIIGTIVIILGTSSRSNHGPFIQWVNSDVGDIDGPTPAKTEKKIAVQKTHRCAHHFVKSLSNNLSSDVWTVLYFLLLFLIRWIFVFHFCF